MPNVIIGRGYVKLDVIIVVDFFGSFLIAGALEVVPLILSALGSKNVMDQRM